VHIFLVFSGLPVTILKAGYKQVVPFLTKLFNDCIDNCMFVNEWKNAPFLCSGVTMAFFHSLTNIQN